MNLQINILTWISLFIVYFIIDLLYARYVISVSDLNAFGASNISVVMYLLTAFGTIQYVENFINIIPIAIGAWLGTFVTLKYEIHKRKKKNPPFKYHHKVKINKLF